MSKKKKSEAWGENGFEDWGGYMAAKKAKLEEQFHVEANKEFQEASTLFEGIAIFVNGYTEPTADELRRLMMAHGGVYHHYMRPRCTTHVIATNLPYSKIMLYRKSQNPIPICKPQWITDSIKAGRLLNFQQYLLYSNCTDVQPQLKYTKKNKEHVEDVDTNDESKNKKHNEIAVLKNDDNNVHQVSSNTSVIQNNLDGKTNNTKNNARCTKDSGFLSEFYSHSRLHHISTMGATFKDYVNELRDKSDRKFLGLARLKELKEAKQINLQPDSQSSFIDEDKAEIIVEPSIMHIDMDCFFVSVGLRDKPELIGLPVAVTHAKGNKHPSIANNETLDTEAHDNDEHGSLSEVASCSYAARKAGVKNGMFLGEALKICPNLKTIPYDFEGYKEVSYMLYDTVASYTLDIEAVSCDEMYADCTKILEESGLRTMEFATIIREEIKQKTGCPVSTGFGSNKLLARLATKKAKPDGQFYISKEDVQVHIGTLNVRDLPGVGGTTAYKLNSIKVHTCADLRALSLIVLQKDFGKKTGEMLYNMCRGIDNSKLNVEHVRKSVSAEVNYGIRFENNEDAVDFLKKLSIEVCNRLKKANGKGRCITLKLMVRAKEAPKETEKFMGHGLCDYMTRSKNLIAPIDDVSIVTKEVITLWTQLQQIPDDVRGIGIQVSRLEISKNKSRNITLMNFVNKNNQTVPSRQCTESDNCNELPSAQNFECKDKSKPKDLRTFFSATAQASTSKIKNTTTGLFENTSPENRDSYMPCEINESVLSELPKDIQDEILGTRRPYIYINDAGNNKEKNSLPPTLNEIPVIQNSDLQPHNNSNMKEEIGKLNLNLNSIQSDEQTELITVTKPPTTNETTGKSVQTYQENFFKHTKSNIGKSTKVEMPPIQEIDMSVLIELPEDIRNEILNEYSANRNQRNLVPCEIENTEIQSVSTAVINKPITAAINQDNFNISFSQVDPEFLAALSEELRRDVQIYCTSKKTENELKTKTNGCEEAAQSSGLTKVANVVKQNKKLERPVKLKNRDVKTAKPKSSKNNKKGIRAVFKTSEHKSENGNNSNKTEKNQNVEPTAFHAGKSKICLNNLTPDETEAILSHNRTISNNENVTEHQEMLINIVNHLFSLPLQQVKMQIQTWITNSKVVNEVDFLSLATFLSMLPEKKRIDDLHILLKTMHRCMTKTGNCIWHKTYRKTVKHVQHYMQIEYNSNLMVPPIRCNLLQCNSDVM